MQLRLVRLMADNVTSRRRRIKIICQLHIYISSSWAVRERIH